MNDGLKDKHRESIIRVLSAHPRVERAVLFGSRAMGTHTTASDVDIALFGEALTLDDQAKLASEIEKLPVPQQVDLLRRNAITNRKLLKHIEEDGIPWYCRQGCDSRPSKTKANDDGTWRCSAMGSDKLKELVRAAIDKLYQRDGDLIRRDVHEVTIAHRLAVYIEDTLRETGKDRYHVDIEYNKNMKRPKDLAPNEGGKRPDIIVHVRESNDHNLLIIEIKKDEAVQFGDADDRKLKGATLQKHSYRFTLGVYLNLKSRQFICTWYEGGKQADEIEQPVHYTNLEVLGNGK